MDPAPHTKPEKIKLVEINSYLTCYLCKGYLIDATTISECLHSFCRSCIIKFLQENCYCPVCEVIINKAKPCLKLDKTLQDIVYKLVPGLFVKEMMRRKRFYGERPELAAKVSSPEARGEDTERTIFNPQDPISLSIEYVSDGDSAPGAISDYCLANNNNNNNNDEDDGDKKRRKGGIAQSSEDQDNPMKRYLQCPGMCRIEVLKKFVRNKYNVDTASFHIDILYKRVPLPDHYTLIDIGYIYSWKRNEPMKFFFRITDIDKVAERFDYFDGRPSPDDVIVAPTNHTTGSARSTNGNGASNVKATKKHSIVRIVKRQPVAVVTPPPTPINKVPEVIKAEKSEDVKSEVKSDVSGDREVTKSYEGAMKNSVYTNITLNRDDNIEIITKIRKVSNGEGHPIGLNIINHTVKKTNGKKSAALDRKRPKFVRFSSEVIVSDRVTPVKTEPTAKSEREREEMEKSNFFKSIQLTAKDSLPKSEQKRPREPPPRPLPPLHRHPSPPLRRHLSLSPPPLHHSTKSSQKRKNSSPMKSDGGKRSKSDSLLHKRPVKIIIQPKTIQNPDVRQMVTNVNQNVNSVSKIVDMTTASSSSSTNNLRKIIDNCKINIPASLSITLNEGGDGGARTPPSIAPVKNFIEILKLPDSKQSSGGDVNNATVTVTTTTGNNNTNVKSDGKTSGSKVPTFQKIFEESIKKTPDFDSDNKTNGKDKKGEAVVVKRNIPEVGKKIKGEGGGSTKSPPATPPTRVEVAPVVGKEETKSNVSPRKSSPLSSGSQGNQSQQQRSRGNQSQQQPSREPSHGNQGQQQQSREQSHGNQSQQQQSREQSHGNQGQQQQSREQSHGNQGQQQQSREQSHGNQSQQQQSREQSHGNQSQQHQTHGNQSQQQPSHGNQSQQQTSASLRSSSLGLNYTVSVAQPKSPKRDVKTSSLEMKPLTSPPLAVAKVKTSPLSANNRQPKAKCSPAKVEQGASESASSNLNSNQLLEKYNIQNLAQLTASFNFNPTGQISALQQAMLQHHIERQNWLNNMNQGPLLQYEKYLQSLSAQNSKLMQQQQQQGNVVKEK